MLSCVKKQTGALYGLYYKEGNNLTISLHKELADKLKLIDLEPIIDYLQRTFNFNNFADFRDKKHFGFENIFNKVTREESNVDLVFKIPTLESDNLKKFHAACASMQILTSYMSMHNDDLNTKDSQYFFYVENNKDIGTWFLSVNYSAAFCNWLSRKPDFRKIAGNMESLYQYIYGKNSDFFKAEIFSKSTASLVITCPGSFNGLRPILNMWRPGEVRKFYSHHLGSVELVILMATLGILHNMARDDF